MISEYGALGNEQHLCTEFGIWPYMLEPLVISQEKRFLAGISGLLSYTISTLVPGNSGRILDFSLVLAFRPSINPPSQTAQPESGEL
jgi:hypothetical protein